MKRSASQIVKRANKRKETMLKSFWKDLRSLKISGISDMMVLKNDKLGFEGEKYFILFSPDVRHMIMPNPFFDIKKDVVFENAELGMNLFEVTGIMGKQSSDCTLEVSPLIPSTQWPTIYALYAQAILPLLHVEAKNKITGKVLIYFREVAALASLQAIVAGIKKQFPKTEVDEKDDMRIDVWIPVEKIEPNQHMYQIGLLFACGDGDDNFLKVALRFREPCTFLGVQGWQDLDTDDDCEGGFGFPPLHLLTPANAFGIFSANLDFVFPAFSEMCQRHAKEV